MIPDYQVPVLLNTIVVLEDRNRQVLPVFWCHIEILVDSLSCLNNDVANDVYD